MGGNTSATRATSAAVDSGPKLNRSVPRASGRATPIARSTCDGSTAPVLRAEPPEAVLQFGGRPTSKRLARWIARRKAKGHPRPVAFAFLKIPGINRKRLLPEVKADLRFFNEAAFYKLQPPPEPG